MRQKCGDQGPSKYARFRKINLGNVVVEVHTNPMVIIMQIVIGLSAGQYLERPPGNIFSVLLTGLVRHEGICVARAFAAIFVGEVAVEDRSGLDWITNN